MSGPGGAGASPRRVEDDRLLRGEGRFIGDIGFDRALHVVFVRSAHAHGTIRSIDVSAAAAAPGVVAVWTGRDFASRITTHRMAPPIAGLKPVDVAPFPVEKVRFVGDLVACVVAETRLEAIDAAEAVAVEIDELTAVASVDAAKARPDIRVSPDLDGNCIARQTFSAGDVDGRFAAADQIVEARFRQQRQTHAPLEPRGCVAVWDSGRRHLTMHAGTQAPHPFRTALAARLGLGEQSVSVVSPEMGGAFGQKIIPLREEMAVAALAMALRRPIRWQEDRGENLMSALHAREESAVVRAAVASDGRILALEVKLEADFGAYCFFPANYMIAVVAMLIVGPYRIDAYAYELDVYLTNKCPAGPMRAPMSSASWIMEGTIDAIARQLGLDPLAVRRTNTIADDAMPYTTATGETYADLSPERALATAATAIGYDEFRTQQVQMRAQGRHLGLGLCAVVESTTYGSAFYRKAGIPGSGHEAATVRVEPTGAVLVSCGLMGSGQGYETTLAQCAVEGLGADFGDIAVQLGQTDVAPYGMGSRGARGATAGGGAVFKAARQLRAKVLAIAAKLLDLNAADALDLQGSKVVRQVDGAWRTTDLTLGAIARIAHLDPLRLPDGIEPGLHVTAAFDPPAMTYSNAVHACIVEVDVETGTIAFQRYLVAHDCGVEINPAIVAGQLHGAVAMGLSGTLMESCYYGADGQNLSGSFMDYALARASDLPNFEIFACNRPNRQTPLGTKGMSEGGVMGAIGALSNAVSDALGPYGIAVESLPLTPNRVYAMIAAAQTRLRT